MAQCILHIGMNKTGTTSIQQSLAGYSDDRFLYANLVDRANHSLPIYTLFAEHPGSHPMHRNRQRDSAFLQNYVKNVRKDLDASVAQAAGRTLIISGEGISNRLDMQGLGRLREYLQQHFEQIRVVGYVRPPAAYLTSVFQQYLFDECAASGLNLKKHHAGYRAKFEKFDEVFGAINTQLWKFEPKMFPAGCVVQDFCRKLDIPLEKARIVQSNESHSRQVVSMTYAYCSFREKCKLPQMKRAELRRVAEIVESPEFDKLRFSDEILHPVLEENREDIEWMEARLGQPLDEDLSLHRVSGIRNEAELLETDETLLQRLSTLLAHPAQAEPKQFGPESLAIFAGQIFEKYVRGRAAGPNGPRREPQLQREVDKLRRLLGERNAQMAGLQAAAAEQSRQVEELTRAVAERDDRIAALKAEAAEHLQQLEALRKNLAEPRQT